jgi:hypothetical protein
VSPQQHGHLADIAIVILAAIAAAAWQAGLFS